MSLLNRRTLLKLGGCLSGGAVGGTSLGGIAAPTEQLVPKAKRVLFLFQSGGPSQLETFDPKPGLAKWRNTELPASVRGDRRITTMTSGQGTLNVANSLIGFRQHGQSGLWVSDVFPHLAGMADDLCMIKSMQGDAVNHDPATNFALTGSQLAGKPSIGAWVSLALGTANPNLPSFVTMTSSTKVQFVQPLTKRLWSSAFLPVRHQGVSLRHGENPVLFLDDGVPLPESTKVELFDAITELNLRHHASTGDPSAIQRNEVYDVASMMQVSMAELADLSAEPEDVFELYGPRSRTHGSFAANCLRARRLLEREVRFVMLMHRGWDHHYTQTEHMKLLADEVDQPTAALLQELKQTGLLDETLVVWGGEFGRTPYSQGEVTAEDHGRDHHPYAFSVFLAGAGVKPGISYGQTDDFSFNVVENGVHIHDLHATILHILGVDHTRLTYPHQGREHRLTDIAGRVVEDILG